MAVIATSKALDLYLALRGGEQPTTQGVDATSLVDTIDALCNATEDCRDCKYHDSKRCDVQRACDIINDALNNANLQDNN